jgi:hypothetical protein
MVGTGGLIVFWWLGGLKRIGVTVRGIGCVIRVMIRVRVQLYKK